MQTDLDRFHAGVAQPSRSYRINTGCGNIYVHVVRGAESGEVLTVFANLARAGGCAALGVESICRLMTVGIEAGVDIGELADKLDGMACLALAHEGSTPVLSCSDAMAKAIYWDIFEDEQEREREMN